jgi:hypothetical protein
VAIAGRKPRNALILARWVRGQRVKTREPARRGPSKNKRAAIVVSKVASAQMDAAGGAGLSAAGRELVASGKKSNRPAGFVEVRRGHAVEPVVGRAGVHAPTRENARMVKWRLPPVGSVVSVGQKPFKEPAMGVRGERGCLRAVPLWGSALRVPWKINLGEPVASAVWRSSSVRVHLRASGTPGKPSIVLTGGNVPQEAWIPARGPHADCVESPPWSVRVTETADGANGKTWAVSTRESALLGMWIVAWESPVVCAEQSSWSGVVKGRASGPPGPLSGAPIKGCARQELLKKRPVAHAGFVREPARVDVSGDRGPHVRAKESVLRGSKSSRTVAFVEAKPGSARRLAVGMDGGVVMTPENALTEMWRTPRAMVVASAGPRVCSGSA